MFFTQDDYKQILEWLKRHSIKDSELPTALDFEGGEYLAITQNETNVKVSLVDFAEQLMQLGVPDFINVSSRYNEKYISQIQAVNLVPVNARKYGQVITFLDTDDNWQLYQFVGESLTQWLNLHCWENLISNMSGEGITPDNEDLVIAENEMGDTIVKFKDKKYDEDSFSGLGRVYLRKNITVVEDENTHLGKLINLLTLNMVSKENTIYIIQYDYTLNGLTITVPEGSKLWMQGGSFRNGTLNCIDTLIIGNKNDFSLVDLAGTYSFTVNTLEEDLVINNDNKILLADKLYSPSDDSGLGRVYVRRNKPFAEQVVETDTIYIIQYDHDLNSQTITVPINSTLRFEGGSINNGVLQCDNTFIIPEFNGTATLEGNYRFVGLKADEEDLSLTDDKTSLKFADRDYSPTNFSSKGYKILRKNIIDDINKLTQEMINQENTIYEIRYDFDLNDQTITIPENCILKFEGGKITNGTITLSNTKIFPFGCIISDYITATISGIYGKGQFLFDPIVNKMILWNGSEWTNLDGTALVIENNEE